MRHDGGYQLPPALAKRPSVTFRHLRGQANQIDLFNVNRSFLILVCMYSSYLLRMKTRDTDYFDLTVQLSLRFLSPMSISVTRSDPSGGHVVPHLIWVRLIVAGASRELLQVPHTLNVSQFKLNVKQVFTNALQGVDACDLRVHAVTQRGEPTGADAEQGAAVTHPKQLETAVSCGAPLDAWETDIPDHVIVMAPAPAPRDDELVTAILTAQTWPMDLKSAVDILCELLMQPSTTDTLLDFAVSHCLRAVVPKLSSLDGSSSTPSLSSATGGVQFPTLNLQNEQLVAGHVRAMTPTPEGDALPPADLATVTLNPTKGHIFPHRVAGGVPPSKRRPERAEYVVSMPRWLERNFDARRVVFVPSGGFDVSVFAADTGALLTTGTVTGGSEPLRFFRTSWVLAACYSIERMKRGVRGAPVALLRRTLENWQRDESPHGRLSLSVLKWLATVLPPEPGVGDADGDSVGAPRSGTDADADADSVSTRPSWSSDDSQYGNHTPDPAPPTSRVRDETTQRSDRGSH